MLMHYVPKAPREVIMKDADQIVRPDPKTNDSPVVDQTPNKIENHVEVLPKIQSPKPLSLNNLAQGFQAYANQRKQQVNNEKTLEITEIRFLEKLIQCVLTQIRINQQKLSSYASQTYTLHCAVSLSKDGSLKQIAISKTSGNIFLDSLIKTIIQDASGSFPPVPQSIKRIPYMLIFDVKIGNYISLQVLLPK